MIFTRKGQGKAASRPHDLQVNVVNMIDVMMILISFLLMSTAVQSYSFGGPDLIPPVSRSEDPVGEGTEVAVTEGAIILDGQVVEANFRDFEDKELHLIPALESGLRVKMERLAAARGTVALDPAAGQPAPGTPVTIRADRRVRFKQIQKVMYTCNVAGFDMMEFAAVRDGL